MGMRCATFAALAAALMLLSAPMLVLGDDDMPTCEACEKCDTCGQCTQPGSVCAPDGTCGGVCKPCEVCYQYGPGAPGCDSCADCLPCDGCQYCDLCDKCSLCDQCVGSASIAEGKEDTTTLEVGLVLVAFVGVGLLAMGNETVRNAVRSKLFAGEYTSVADGDAETAATDTSRQTNYHAVVSTHDPPSPRNPLGTPRSALSASSVSNAL